jgi:1-phosphofructokinase
MTERHSNVCVFGSSLLLTISIEPAPDQDHSDELHFHPGGQGFWIARMLTRLDSDPVLVSPLGGEAGQVLQALADAWGVRLHAVAIRSESPGYVHDRRSGERQQLAQSRMPSLDRHELDDLYGAVLGHAATTGHCVVTGRFPDDATPLDFYRRLGADLASIDAVAIGDLHGDELGAFLAGGPLHTLKVSDDDLVADGLLPAGATLEQRLAAARQLVERGARRVVISAAKGPTLFVTAKEAWRASPPLLATVDHRGSGDAMTAGLTYAAMHDFDATRTLRLACAAGAANATRRGLGNADGELVRSLAERVEVFPAEATS